MRVARQHGEHVVDLFGAEAFDVFVLFVVVFEVVMNGNAGCLDCSFMVGYGDIEVSGGDGTGEKKREKKQE